MYYIGETILLTLDIYIYIAQNRGQSEGFVGDIKCAIGTFPESMRFGLQKNRDPPFLSPYKAYYSNYSNYSILGSMFLGFSV